MENKTQKDKSDTENKPIKKTAKKKPADNTEIIITVPIRKNPADVEIVETEQISDFYELEQFNWEGTTYNTTIPKKIASKKKYELPNPKLIKAFIPGTIKNIFVSDGSKVKKNDTLLVLEAMKMKNNLLAPFNGVIKKVHTKQGTLVSKNELLVEFL